MLKQLRSRKVMKRIMQVTLILVIPSFVIFYGWSSLDQTRNNNDPNRAVAKIKPPSWAPIFAKWQPVSPLEMALASHMLMDKAEMAARLGNLPFPQGARPTDLFSNGEILREAVNLRILRQYAKDNGLWITDADLQQQIKSEMPQLLEPSYRAYIFQMKGYSTEQEFLESLRDSNIYFRVMSTFMNDAKVSMFELWQEYTLQKEKLQLDYVRITADKFKASIKVEPAALESFFAKNRAKYRIPEQRIYDYIAISKDDIEKKTTITDADVKKYYEDNPGLFQTSARVKVRQIKMAFPKKEEPVATPEMTKQMDELLKKAQQPGADFTKLASQSALESVTASQPTSSPMVQGGEFWISNDDESKYGRTLIDAALALKKPGDVTEVVQGQDGLYILQAQQFEQPTTRPYQGDVIENARTQVKTKKIQDELDAMTKKLQDAAREQTTLTDMSKALGLPVKTTALINASDVTIDPGVGPLSRDQEYLQMLSKGDRVSVLTTDTGAIALTINKAVPEHDPTLAEVRQKVEDDYRTQEALKQAQELAKEASEKNKTLPQLQEWARQHGLTVERTQQGFERTGKPTELNEDITNFANLTYKTAIGSIRDAELTVGGAPTGYIVWRIRSIEPPTRDQFL